MTHPTPSSPHAHPAASPTPAAKLAERVLRRRDSAEAKVTFEELFFDLVYVFAVTQLSHFLLGALTPLGVLQTVVLWFAVWLGWQYTCWVTNWFDPRTLRIRLMLFVVMIVGLVMAAALPQAFGAHGLGFAVCFALMQAGRSLYVLLHLGSLHALTPNFRRILGWNLIAGAFWIAGGLSDPSARLGWWMAAVACEYLSPMAGFWLPGLGRSRTADWTIDGGHLAERCQLFMIVALGESLLMIGATLSKAEHPDAFTIAAFATAFVTSIAIWWLYFHTTSRDGTHKIEHADDPGRMGAYFHYVHVVIVAGIIVSAVANELLIAHPHGTTNMQYAALLTGALLLYLLGNGLYRLVVYGGFPRSHAAGAAALLVLGLVATRMEILLFTALAGAVLVAMAVWETLRRH